MLLEKEFGKLREEFPKLRKLKEERQLLVVEDFLKKMNL